MVTVLLPGLLADQAGGRKEFQLEAPTVGAALQALPVRDLLFNERNELRPLVNVYVDGEDIRGRERRRHRASRRRDGEGRRSGGRRLTIEEKALEEAPELAALENELDLAGQLVHLADLARGNEEMTMHETV